METELRVKALRHADVRGKELLYLIVGGVIINVGGKTYSQVYNVIKKQRERNGETDETDAQRLPFGD